MRVHRLDSEEEKTGSLIFLPTRVHNNYSGIRRKLDDSGGWEAEADESATKGRRSCARYTCHGSGSVGECVSLFRSFERNKKKGLSLNVRRIIESFGSSLPRVDERVRKRGLYSVSIPLTFSANYFANNLSICLRNYG